MTLVLFIVICGFMLVEARRADQNERAQRARGGIDIPGDASVYATMRIAYPAAFAVMLIERIISGGPPADIVVMGAAIYTAAKALKWWAILELGRFWTFRVIVVPGAPLVRSGPYRYMRHPNYVGVFGELVGTALMCGAAVTGPPATLLFTALMLRRTVVEHRALHAAR
jgi:methyltransferase